MVMLFMITTAARLASLVSRSKQNAWELWGSIGFSFKMDRSKESSSCTLPLIKSQKRSCLLDTDVSPYSCCNTVIDVVFNWHIINIFIQFKGSDRLNERADFLRKSKLASSKAMNERAFEPFHLLRVDFENWDGKNQTKEVSKAILKMLLYSCSLKISKWVKCKIGL